MASAGRLRDRVTFQRSIRTADGGGGFTVVWTNFLTVWAQFVPERGGERLQAGRLEAALAGLLRIRSSSDSREVTSSHSVLIRGERYQVRSISNPDQRNAMLEMIVEKGVAT